MMTSSILFEAYLYFSPHFLVVIMVWLWSLNIWMFEGCHVDYRRALHLPANGPFSAGNDHLTLKRILLLALAMLVACLLVVGLYLLLLFYDCYMPLAACLPMLAYPAIVVFLLCRFGLFYDLLERHRRMVLPIAEVCFADTFLADMLTSVAKVFSDFTCSGFRMAHGEIAKKPWYEDVYACGGYFFPVPVGMSIPYFIQLFQCLRRWWVNTNEMDNFLNAVKYGTSIAMIISSTIWHYKSDETWAKNIMICFSFINSCYSFIWDVCKDWNITERSEIEGLYPNQHPILKWIIYAVIVVTDFCLRFTWLYKLFTIAKYSSPMIFGVAAIEILRRCLWSYFRVENELRKIIDPSTNPPTDPIDELREPLVQGDARNPQHPSNDGQEDVPDPASTPLNEEQEPLV